MDQPVIDTVKQLLGSVLQLGPRAALLTAATPLLGNLPELDSLAVEMLLTELESRFGISFMDDELSADDFATVGALVDFVKRKAGGK